jgi:1-deoxy-D-xylulose-5-phosphate synthase
MVDRGGLVGDDGPTHHGMFDLTFLRAIPNLIVMAPKDENELASMVRTAAEYDEGPVAVRYPRGAGLGVHMEFEPPTLPIGRAEVLREGSDLSLVAVGSMVCVAEAAARDLANQGVEASVVNARFIKPLDGETIIGEARRTKRILTLEENTTAGGFGAAVLELVQAEELDDVVVRLAGLPDAFVTHGGRGLLLKECGLDVDTIVRRGLRFVGGAAGQGGGTR